MPIGNLPGSYGWIVVDSHAQVVSLRESDCISGALGAARGHRHRFLFANDPQALSAVLAVMQRALSTFVIRHSGLTVASGARSGAVTLIQRFGSALNLNIHLHMLFLDGAYTFRGKRAIFHRARRPTGEELNHLLDTLARRIVRVLERGGLLIADPQLPRLERLCR